MIVRDGRTVGQGGEIRGSATAWSSYLAAIRARWTIADSPENKNSSDNPHREMAGSRDKDMQSDESSRGYPKTACQ